MQVNEVKSILKTIDLAYGTSYEDTKEMIEHFYKYLKDFNSDDVNLRLSEYINSSEPFPPKVYHLTHGLLTTKGKEELKGIKQQCHICKRYIKLEGFEEHYSKCSKISFIKIHAKSLLNQEIDIKKYYQMSEDELDKKHMQMSKIVLEKSDNEMLKNCIKHYVEE